MTEEFEKSVIEKYGSIENYKKELHDRLSGKHYYTNGIEDRKFSDNEEIPEGFYKGRTNAGKGTKGYFFINNGEKQTQIKSESSIPEGWVKGALPLTETHKQRISIALKKYIKTDAHRMALSISHRTESYRIKIQQTTRERYGVDNVFESPIIRAKADRTKEERYGDKNYNNREKTSETVRKHLGVDWPTQHPLVRALAKETRNKSKLLKVKPDVIKLRNPSNSKPNLKFMKLLEKNNIQYEREFTIQLSRYDFKILNSNILIEINPTITHNSLWTPFGNHEGLKIDYHLNKSNLAEQNGYRVIHIFDWDSYEDIIQMIQLEMLNSSIYNNKCYTLNIQKFNDSIQVELLNSITNGLESFLLFKRFNENNCYEMINHYQMGNYYIVNNLFRYFLEIYKPKSVITFCDNSKFISKNYVYLGFKLEEKIEIDRHWYNIKSKEYFIGDVDESNYSKYLLPVYDCGVDVFIYNNEIVKHTDNISLLEEVGDE